MILSQVSNNYVTWNKAESAWDRQTDGQQWRHHRHYIMKTWTHSVIFILNRILTFWWNDFVLYEKKKRRSLLRESLKVKCNLFRFSQTWNSFMKECYDWTSRGQTPGQPFTAENTGSWSQIRDQRDIKEWRDSPVHPVLRRTQRPCWGIRGSVESLSGGMSPWRYYGMCWSWGTLRRPEPDMMFELVWDIQDQQEAGTLDSAVKLHD